MNAYSARKWAKGSYRIIHRGAHGFEVMGAYGYTCHPFAARLVCGLWSLDHLPTGRTLGKYRRLSDAKEAARELVAEAGGTKAWEFTEVSKVPGEVLRAVATILQPLTRIT